MPSNSPLPSNPAEPAASSDPLRVEVGGLVYQLDRQPRKQGRRSVVAVQLAAGASGPPLVDRVDLFAFRSRRAFGQLVADVFGREVGDVLGHLALVLDHVERSAAQPPALQVPVLDARRVAAADELLGAPGLLDRAAGAMTALGYVGEERTKRLAYLVATSRLLPRPLSLILMAPSGCGKSELLDAVAALMPCEQVEFLSRLTAQALYYAGADALRHKLVLVDEQSGTSEADYAIRTLQSKGLLRLAAPASGKPAEPITVHGPIALMSGTTSSDLNPENLSRCLELTLDDSPEQTARVQAAQRAAWAGRRPVGADPEPWCDAQCRLEPLGVVIPYAERLAFPARTTADRRGNQKLLGLVAAHALLCQRQRERDREGRVVATVEDYRVVHGLLQPAMADEVPGLSMRAGRIYRYLAQRGQPLTRREIAAELGGGYNTAKRGLAELLAQELVTISDRGPPTRYRLLDRTVLGCGASLVEPGALEARQTPARRSRRPASKPARRALAGRRR